MFGGAGGARPGETFYCVEGVDEDAVWMEGEAVNLGFLFLGLGG